MDTVPSPANTGSPVRLCSDKHCKTILNLASKSNLCRHCVARVRFPRSLSTSRNAPNDMVVPSMGFPQNYTPNTSGTAAMGVNMFVESANSAVSLRQSRQESFAIQPTTNLPLHKSNMGGNSSERQVGRPQISSFASHQRPNILRVPSSGPITEQGEPLLNHFNSRGELINVTKYAVQNGRNTMDIGETRQLQDRFFQNCSQCKLPMAPTESGDICGRCYFARDEVSIAISRTTMTTPVEIKFINPKPEKDDRPDTNINVSREAKSAFDNVHVDTEGLELVYPATSDVDPTCQSGSAQCNPKVQKLPTLHTRPQCSFQQPSHTRPKHPVRRPFNFKKRPDPYPTQQATSPKPRPSMTRTLTKVPTISAPKEAATGKNMSLKLCSTANCTGIISINSFATRCLDCVKSNWKSQRAKLSSVEANDESKEDGSTASGILKNSKPVAQNNKKRGVTWADEVLDKPSAGTEKPPADYTAISATNMLSSIQITNIESSSDIQERPSVMLHLTDNLDLTNSLSANSGPRNLSSQSPSNDSSTRCLQEVTESPIKSPEKNPERIVHFLSTPPCDHSPSSPPPKIAVSKAISDSVSSVVSLIEASTSNTQLASGWGSDLTELSDSEDDTDSGAHSNEDSSETDANTKTQQPSTLTGLKIRIPARPGGVYAPKCASARCNNTLAPGYRWKSCVLCRARSRDYQRRRQNIQGGHLRLEHELSQAQIINLSMPGDFIRRDPEKDPTMLVPGARLCSVRDCSYIVPPANEYRWKMCALCRLRRREQKKQETQNDAPLGTSEPRSPSDSKRKAKHAEMLLKLNGPLFTSPTRPSGRCQSLDCGMLVTNAKSTQCEQCIGRSLWIMKRSGHYPTTSNPSRNYAEKPRNLSPYPQFQCFSAFLLEFKNRLSGFLHAQSVFFLFKQPKHVNSVFAFDGEYSVCALDFDLLRRKEEIDSNALKLKREIEHVGRIKFSPKRLVTILDGGGIAVRFGCIYPVPILQASKSENQQQSITTMSMNMQCELEIASLPDHSHRFIPGQRSIIRFRLLG